MEYTKINLQTSKLFNKEMRVIPLKIVKYDWKNHWLSALQVAAVMSSATINPSKMAAIANFITVYLFVANMAKLRFIEFLAC